MKVTTIDGGFRGLRGKSRFGNLSTGARLTASESFASAIQAFLDAKDALVREGRSATLTENQYRSLLARAEGLQAQLTQHLLQIDELRNEAELSVWRTRATDLAAGAARLEREIALVVVDQRSITPWQIGLAVAGVVGVVGVLWYLSAR